MSTSPPTVADTRSRAAGGGSGAHRLHPSQVWPSFTAMVASWTRLDIVVVMTLILLLLHVQGFPTVPVQVLAIAGLVYRPLSRQPVLWFLITALLVVGRVPFAWFSLVNHHYLMMYWVLALGLAFLSPRPERVLALSARVILGLVFAFATLWKLISPDFVDGSFFEFTLMMDPRFEIVASPLGGLASDGSEANTAALAAWWDPLAEPAPVALESGPAIPWIARVMSLWGVLLEGSLAVLFLVPWRGRLAGLREPALLLFIVTTYPFAPVIGFAWMLLAMALAQSRWPAPTGEAVYTLLFVVLHLFDESSVLWVIARRITGLG